MKRSAFIGLVSIGILSGCSSVSVNRDFDSTFDFPRLKTFAWQHETQPQTGVPRIDNDLNDRRIRVAVENDLQLKGFQLVDQAEATFLITYFMDFQQRIDGSGSSVSFGLGAGSIGRSAGMGVSSGGSVSDYEEAQLTIDILNPENEQMIWRGRGRRRLHRPWRACRDSSSRRAPSPGSASPWL